MVLNREAIHTKLQQFETRLPSHVFIHTLGFTAANEWDLIKKLPKKVRSGVWALDLETGTGPNAKVKEQGRENIARALWTLPFSDSVRLYIRTNLVDSVEFSQDLRALFPEKPAEIENTHASPLLPKGIVLPKVNCPDDFKFANHLLSQLEEKNSLPVGTLSIIGIIETGAGMNNLQAIVAEGEKNPRIGYLAYGEEDLRFDLGVLPNEIGNRAMHERRSRFIDFVGPSRLQAIDRVWTNIHDVTGLQQDSIEGRALGFKGKMIISPNQIEPVLKGFIPNDQQISQQEKIIDAYEEALARGGGVTVVDGKLIERQHYLEALQFLYFVCSIPPTE